MPCKPKVLSLLNNHSQDSLDLVRLLMRILAVGLVFMTAVFLITICFSFYHLGNTILLGVYVQNINVGGLTPDEAVLLLTRELPNPETLGVDVKISGQTWPLSWADVGQSYDIDATVQSAYSVGRSATEKPSLLARLQDQNVTIMPVITPANPTLIRAYVAEIAAEVEIAPINAHFSLNLGEMIATSGQSGQCLEIETSVARIQQALAEGEPAVELIFYSIEPNVIEPEPARTQARGWLSQPFVLIINNSVVAEMVEDQQTEFSISTEIISTWLEPRVTGQNIELYINEAAVEAWVEEIALQLTPEQSLDTTATLQNMLIALQAGEHQAEAQLRLTRGMYTVQLGDTLLGIALEFNTTVDELKVFNNLRSDLIITGQRLIIPSALTPELSREIVIGTPPTDIAVPDLPATHSINWREDLAVLVERINRLPEIHGEGFQVVYDESFIQAVNALDAAIPTLVDHQIVVGLMRILALLNDAHTNVRLSRWEDFQESAYPIQLQWFSDGLYVTAAQPGYEDLLALELVQIGRVPILQVMTLLAEIIPHENSYGLRAASTNYMLRPVILHALGLTADLTRAVFVFRNATDHTITRYLIADSPVIMQDRWVLAVPQQTSPLYLQKLQDYYWYTYLESSRALYFQFNLSYQDPGLPFAIFLEDISNVITTQAVDKYIIDLRHNPGGLPSLPGLIAFHLEAHPQFSQNRKLFVLIGNQTFSSGVYLTSMLQQQFNATLIGEPTGQGANFYASPEEFVLPNSGLTINFSSTYWDFAEVTRETIFPDISVPISSIDYFAGLDPVLNTALSQP